MEGQSRRWLLRVDDAITETDFPIAPDSALRCTPTGQVLTDLHGDISLDVPVIVDHGATTVDVGAVMRSALKSALVGAVTSPLKTLTNSPPCDFAT